MRACFFSAAALACIAICFVVGAAQAADGLWTNRTGGAWSSAAQWTGGVVAGGGGTATFRAAAGGPFQITNDLGTVTLSGLTANTASGTTGVAMAEWVIVGGTNEMVAPALIHTPNHSLSVRPSTLSGNADITITGLGRFFLGDDNLYTGRTIVSNGNVRVARDSGLGPAPASYSADAIILDGGGLANDGDNFVLSLDANRGITVTANGGFLSAAYTGAGLVVNAPVTGTGLLGINFENSPVTLSNPLNDYSGGTVVGTNGPGANAGCAPTLKLGQDEVLPHGSGKGALKVGADSSFYNTFLESKLDLNGKRETVNTLFSGPKAEVTSSVANQGRLIVGGLGEDSEYRGKLTGGATIEKQGSGTLNVIGARVSNGTLDLKSGALVAGGPNLETGSTVLFDGGEMVLSQPSGLYEFYGAGGASFSLSAALTYSGWKLWPEKASETVAATFVNGRQYVYRGRWHLPQAGVYSFAKGFDDGGALTIDGTTVLNNNTSGTKAVANDVALGAGWHAVEVRVSDIGGGVGPQFGFRSGILYDPLNGGFTNATELARARMFTDDGGTNLVGDGVDNVLAGRLMLAQSGTLSVPAAAGKLIFAGIVTTNAPVQPEPVLTVENGGLPLLFGSAGTWPSVLDASVYSQGGIVFTNRVWLRRAPTGDYSFANGSDLALDGSALLGDTALNLTHFSVRVLRDDSVGGDGSVTANVGTVVWFDTMRYVGNRLTNSTAAQAYENNVTLNSGTARFTGAGPITYGGALKGTGNAVKDGSGDLFLTGSGSSLAGEIQINAGRLLPADETALGGATVRLNGGRLANPTGADLTLNATPVTAQTGGFEVTAAGETMAVNGPVTGGGSVSKWGGGTLTLGGAVINTNLNLHVREGTLELAKSGEPFCYALLNLIGIESNALVRLSGSNGNQVGGGVTLSGGTFDLNGRDEVIGVLTNTFAGGIVTNGGAQAVTLSAGEGGVSSLFTGLLSDGALALSLAKVGTGTLTLSPNSIAYSGGTRVEGGTLRLSRPAPPMASLSYWLDATDRGKLTVSGSNVTAWADSSSAGVDFAQGTLAQQPVYVPGAINGRPAVRFSNTARNRMTANKSATAQTVFIVCRMSAFSSLDGIWGQSGQDAGIRANQLTRWQHTGNGANANDFSMNGQMYINGAAGSTFAAQQPHILTAISLNASTWTTAIGDYWASPDYFRYFKGDIGEVLVYSKALSTEERQAVEAYLTAKWLGGTALTLSQSVSVASGAQLAVDNLNLDFAALSGAGVLVPEGNSVVNLGTYTAFTGTVAGAGTVALKAENGADARFLPQGFGTVVRNDGALAAILRIETAETNTFSGSVRDGAQGLGITQSGTGTVYYSGTNSTYTGATRIEAGNAIVQDGCFAQYVRFAPVLMRIGGQHYATNQYQLSEFQLTLGGDRLPYPAGTAAYGRLGNTNLAEPPASAIDGSVDTKFYTTLSDSLGPNGLTVAMPYPVMFDGYRWFTANDGPGRDPVKWRVETSMDGVTWTVVDYQNYEANMTLITTVRKALAGAWSVSALAQMNVLSDVSPTTVAAPGRLGVSRTRETVGALSGDGTVLLAADATLGINAFVDAAFGGGISGTGTVVKTGAETQALSGALAFRGSLLVEAGILDLNGATLSGITNIVIKNGAALTGAATVNNALTVTFETGGMYSASLAVAGTLTVTGPVKLVVPEGATYPYYNTLFTFTSADQSTRSALLAAIMPSPVPTGQAAVVRVTDNTARLTIASVGTALSIR